jgi:hypothetical protein
MDAATIDLCACGSGLPFARCHGDPGNDYAREAALHEARLVAALFPSVRVRDDAVVTFLDGIARGLGDDEEPNEELVAHGLTLIDEHERRRLIDSWAEPYADRWASLTHASGDPTAAERALVLGALEVGVAERSRTPRSSAEAVESGPGASHLALALVIPPMFVWSRDEAGAAEAAASGRRRTKDRLAAVEQVASSLMTFGHVGRTRALVARVAEELPFAALPRASGFLGDACRGVQTDLSLARAVAASLLIAYVEELATTRDV